MQNYSGVKKNSGYILYVGLMDQAAATISLRVNPTIAAGDFKVSTDGGAFANLTTLPVVTPAGGRAVKITLSAAEMNGDNIMVMCVDAAGAEWCDLCINIQTQPLDSSLVQVDGTVLASATLNLKKLNVVNSSGDAVVFSSTGGNGSGLDISGNGTGHGILSTGGATGHGVLGLGGATSGVGILGQGGGNGPGIAGQGVGASQPGIEGSGGTDGPGIGAYGAGAGSGFQAGAGATGHGIDAYGGAISGTGMIIHAVGSGNGMQVSGAAGGSGAYFIGNGAGSGMVCQGGVTGHGLNSIGGATSGSGFNASAVGNGPGITATGVANVSILATQGLSGPLDTTTYNAITDNILKRDWTAISGEANYSVLNALRYQRNWSISGTTLTVWADFAHTVPAFTVNLTSDAAGVPVVGFAS